MNENGVWISMKRRLILILSMRIKGNGNIISEYQYFQIDNPINNHH